MIFYTYLHRRNDTNAIFYVGKGKEHRAWQFGRNRWWNSIANKVEYTVEICAQWATEKEAFEHEKFLISCFKDLGYKLTNQTDGGDGASGRVRPESERQAISEKMKIINLGENNPMFGKDPWNKGFKGHPNNGGVKKGQKRPGIGGVKKGTIPWNKGLTGIPSGKKGKTYKINPK